MIHPDVVLMIPILAAVFVMIVVPFIFPTRSKR